MTEVEPRLKTKVQCPCGHETCDRYGTPKKNGHVAGCPCIKCRNRRNATSGNRKGTAARKALNIPGVNSRHEEVWGGLVRVEVKSGRQVGPVKTRYELAERQSEAARPIGDNRPFVFVAMPEGWKDGLFLCRLSNLHEAAVALLEQWGAT